MVTSHIPAQYVRKKLISDYYDFIFSKLHLFPSFLKCLS